MFFFVSVAETFCSVGFVFVLHRKMFPSPQDGVSFSLFVKAAFAPVWAPTMHHHGQNRRSAQTKWLIDEKGINTVPLESSFLG